jgi:GntR family transcriptional repressor for pyruvate dehydrogenase complex
MATTSLRQPKMASQIVDQLRDQIIRGTLKDGDVLLTEAELGAQFGVSRPTLREALRILESESLIRITRGSRGGARVVAPSERMVARYVARYLDFHAVPVTDVHRAMMAIELPAVEKLARTAGVDDIDALMRQLDVEGASEHTWADAVSAGTDFHRLLVDLAGNRTLAIMHRMIEEIIIGAAAQIGLAYQSEVDTQAHSFHVVHMQIVGLLRDRAVEEASALWSRHLRAKIKVLERMEASNGSEGEGQLGSNALVARNPSNDEGPVAMSRT